MYNEYIGGRYWSNPGGFANGFKGVCAVFVTAAFSFSGTELVGLAASETPNPRATVPAAVKGTFWRVVCTVILQLEISISDPNLTDRHLRQLFDHHRSSHPL